MISLDSASMTLAFKGITARCYDKYAGKSVAVWLGSVCSFRISQRCMTYAMAEDIKGTGITAMLNSIIS